MARTIINLPTTLSQQEVEGMLAVFLLANGFQKVRLWGEELYGNHQSFFDLRDSYYMKILHGDGMLHLEIFRKHKTSEVTADGLFSTEGRELLRKLQPLLVEIDSRRLGHGLLQETPRPSAFCSKCGTPFEPDAKFCEKCGTPRGDAPPKTYRTLIMTCLGCGCASMVGFVLLIGVSVWFFFSTMSKMAKEDYYTIGNDRIPSVKLALGEERKVTGISASVVAGGATTKVITYQVPGTEQGREMFKYYTYLHDKDGFLPLADFDFSGPTGTGVIARNSVDNGQMVHLKIEYNTEGYTITLTKLQGEVTPKIPAEDTTEGADNPNTNQEP